MATEKETIVDTRNLHAKLTSLAGIRANTSSGDRSARFGHLIYVVVERLKNEIVVVACFRCFRLRACVRTLYTLGERRAACVFRQAIVCALDPKSDQLQAGVYERVRIVDIARQIFDRFSQVFIVICKRTSDEKCERRASPQSTLFPRVYDRLAVGDNR